MKGMYFIICTHDQCLSVAGAIYVCRNLCQARCSLCILIRISMSAAREATAASLPIFKTQIIDEENDGRQEFLRCTMQQPYKVFWQVCKTPDRFVLFQQPLMQAEKLTHA